MATKAERFAIIRDRRNKAAELERKNKKPKMALMDVQTLWTDLQAGMFRIFAPANERQELPVSRYMELYSNVYNYCCNVSERPMRGFKGTRTGCYEGGQLYNRLTYFLQLHLHNIVQGKPLSCSEEQILQFYVDKCDDYTFSATVLDGMFSYLNRNWVPVQRQTDPSVLETYLLALSCWKDTLFKDLNKNVTDAILRLITKERRGESVNGKLIQTVITSYIELGTVDSSYAKSLIDSTNLAVYIHHFEKTFLKETTEFYSLESNQFLLENSVPEYMKRVEQRLAEEESRVRKFLHISTLLKLIHNCEQALIRPHLATFYCQFEELLQNNQTEDLRRLYNLVNRLSLEYTTEMSKEFETHVTAFGHKSLEQLSQADHNNQKFPEDFFTEMFKVYDQYNELVKTAFVSDMRFRKALDSACTGFVNKNCVTVALGTTKSAFILAKYSDRLLKNSGKNKNFAEADIENKMDGLMAIFKFLEAKDIFQKHYSVFLASRLINGTSASDEWERSLIAKMKISCGQEYTAKMQRMFLDIESTRLLSGEFKEWMVGTPIQKLPYNFFIHVLTSGSWVYTAQNDEFIFPQQLELARTNFTQFYNTKHSGRKLCWLAGRSHGELNFYPSEFESKPKTFTFVASTYQMSILLLFNSAEQVSVGDMIDTIRLVPEILEQVLQILIKHKILMRSPPVTENEPFTRDSILTLVKKFIHDRCRININTPLRMEARREVERVDEDVITSRGLVIWATLVRIMKARQKLKHLELISEVIDQVKASFHPDLRMIRLAIDKSLTQDYIARDPDDKNTYTYIA